PLLGLLQKEEELETKFPNFLAENIEWTKEYYTKLYVAQGKAIKTLERRAEHKNLDEVEILILAYLAFSKYSEVAEKSKEILGRQIEDFIDSQGELKTQNDYIIYRALSAIG